MPVPPLFFKLHRNLSSLARFSAFSSPSLGVYKTLFALSLCFCLGACGGGSSSSPSSNNSDSAEETPSPEEETPSQDPKEPKDCAVENGQGQQNWDASSGNWNDECELIACNAGHDNQESNNVCAETPAGHYSLANSKKRTACEGKPDDGDASWTEAKGLAGPDECEWTCDNAGYDNQEDGTRCQPTIAGYYSLAGSNERMECTGKSANSSWRLTTGLTSANECAWACNEGYDDNDGNDTCEETAEGYYSPADSNARRACSKPVNSAWTSGRGLTSAGECAWACDEGYDNQKSSSLCEETPASYYSPASSNAREECTGKPLHSTWSSATGLTSADECVWACEQGYYKPTHRNACVEIGPSVTAGRYHTCAMLKGGAVQCWGYNKYSQTGGTDTTATDKVDVNLGQAFGQARRAKMIAAGSHHTCALLDGGDVRCWGATDSSQAGSTHINFGQAQVPNFGKGRRVTDIATGWGHTCVILDGGDVQCWGINDCGQASGDGHKESSCVSGVWSHVTTNAVEVDLGQALGQARRAKNIVAGTGHTCVILNGGDVKCWGDNRGKQTGGVDQQSTLAVDVNLARAGQARAAIALAAGWAHTCALLDGGDVKCWGSNSDGQLGGGDVDLGQTQDGQARTAIAITAGGNHTCAILNGGDVQCWGKNGNGQAGGVDRSSTSKVAVNLGTGRTATAIAAGDFHTCAVLDGGAVKCWGRHDADLADYPSAVRDEERTACTDGKPAHSSWEMAIGMTPADECAWACNAGYDDHAGDGTCEVTPAGHYSLAGSNERGVCPDKPDDSSWTDHHRA